ncbi:hypothetical protein ACXZ9C_11710 [Streptococcus agalactiae]
MVVSGVVAWRGCVVSWLAAWRRASRRLVGVGVAWLSISGVVVAWRRGVGAWCGVVHGCVERGRERCVHASHVVVVVGWCG